MIVKTIEAQMTYAIRHSVLRPHQRLDDCKYDTDEKEHSFHIGAFDKGKLVTIASFCIEQYDGFDYSNQYRLRAMATISDYRNRGIGRQVVAFGEDILRKRHVPIIWCKARTSALNYYKKLGFTTYGTSFDYPGIGEHIIMYKELL